VDQDNNHKIDAGADERMRGYLQKIATGPTMSKDLSEAEAEDALSLVLDGSVSQIRSGVFLVSARMKRETQEENIGYWRALDKTALRQDVQLDTLLQMADPFDGFNRAPYFGFYAIPVIAAMGLPAYGHSSMPLPPKFGVTFENILTGHYGLPENTGLDRRGHLIEEFGFGYLGLQQSHPRLDALRELRKEIVKRPMLATWEKMLMPLKARKENFLATTYFHRGYETDMLAIARLSQFSKTVLGNGLESCVLFGVHKPAKIFIESGEQGPEERTLKLETMFDVPTAKKIATAYEALKAETATLSNLAAMGESALKGNPIPSAPLIACQAGTLCHLFGQFPDPQTGYNAAEAVLQSGAAHKNLMRYIEAAR
jgi:anthranilate phosphoribosyltransferase